MKEKIGMEKLIELLNEFYKEKGDIFRAIQHNDRLKVFELENDDLVRDTAIISKEYGFIKWLVENDKIETEKVGEIGFIGKYDFETNYYLVDEDNVYDKCETLLMLLSISDTPIEDLISYLK